MASKADQGQALIELVLTALILAACFMMAFELSRLATRGSERERFASSHRSSATPSSDLSDGLSSAAVLRGSGERR